MISSIYRRINSVSLTDSAAKRLTEILKGKEDSFLRLDVSDGGCGGLQYSLKLDNRQEPDDDATIIGKAHLRVSKRSLPYVAGAKVDFLDDPFNQIFKVVDNPNASASCSCGSSFSPTEEQIENRCGPKV
eukprot:gnl/Chilomastix_caulleri/730.p1 GENE.gnl/Chilomastix_caulleri/730~~gnl/Chilomastix_caulleri/730.p1  ORF type:complete len:130 (+),score=29.17 gnl/Chilomastix_caulleri/730:84-473(+)